MFFLHLSLHGHQSWLRSTVTCALIHAYSLHQILSLLHCHPYRPTDTLKTVLHVNMLHSIPLFHVISPLHRYQDSRHDYYMFVNYWYADTLLHGIPLYGYSVHVLHYCYVYSPVYMHWLSMCSCYMDHGLYYSWIFLYSRYIDHCLCHMDYCYMSSSSCIPVTWLFPVLILIFPLLDTWVVDMRCVKLSVAWVQVTKPPLEFHISCFSFPIVSFYQ